MTDIVYLDLETTGVESRRHTIFDMGFIFTTPSFTTFARANGELEIWVVPTAEEMCDADANALRVNSYNEIALESASQSTRTGRMTASPTKREYLASQIARWTDGVIFAGCNVKFDQEFLEAWLRRHGACPTWDYHVLDIPTYAAGVWNAKARHIDKGTSLSMIPPPFKTSALAKAYGIPEPKTAHTALGDAQWGKLLYEAAVSKTQ